MSRSPPNEAKPLSTLRGQIAIYSNTLGQQFCPLSRNAGCPLNQGLFVMGVYGEMLADLARFALFAAGLDS